MGRFALLTIDDAYEIGFRSFGLDDTCPYHHPDLKHWWWSGWFDGLANAALVNNKVTV